MTVVLGEIFRPRGHQLLQVADPLQDAVQSGEDVFVGQQSTHLRDGKLFEKELKKFPQRHFIHFLPKLRQDTPTR